MKNIFHLALPCKSVSATRKFYIEKLGCKEGRSASLWIDINFRGNQLTFTNSGDYKFDFKNYRLGESTVPSFHFGAVLSLVEWKKMHEHLSKIGVEVFFNTTYHTGKVGEQYSFFIQDPNGYNIEYKAFKKEDEVFE